MRVHRMRTLGKFVALVRILDIPRVLSYLKVRRMDGRIAGPRHY